MYRIILRGTNCATFKAGYANPGAPDRTCINIQMLKRSSAARERHTGTMSTLEV